MQGASEQSERKLQGSLDWHRLRWTVVALSIGIAAACGSGAALADSSPGAFPPGSAPVDVSDTVLGARLGARASERMVGLGLAIERRELRVLHDAEGYLVVPRDTALITRPDRSSGTARGVVLPIVRARAGRHLLGRVPAGSSPSWVLAGGACYERISDGWSWLDHCARVFRLLQDGDPQRDFYALQRYGTAGANVPWVLKEAQLGASPVESSAPMSWQDWSPRSDRSGSCQTFTERVTSPISGVIQSVERCENWDITKGAIGGEFTLEWSGCACIQDRELGYVFSISVAQGSLPAWYVPAQIHGFAF